MPPRHRRPAMYNTPAIRTGGFGALQVEALTNRPLSIARRHLAASQLRMRDIEPDELSSSEWVRFLVMEERERERWMTDFSRRRRSSSSASTSSNASGSGSPGGSSSSSSGGRSPISPVDAELAYDKAEEARLEAAEAEAEEMASRERERVRRRERGWEAERMQRGRGDGVVVGSTPAVSQWVRQFDGEGSGAGSGGGGYSSRRPMHVRRDMDSLIEAPPTYESVVRPGTPPPAYEPREAR